MKALICAAVLATATVIAHADETKLGAGVTLKDATPISALLAKPADYVGKTIRVDGIATAVCTGNGCWMAIAQDDAKDAPTLRVKVEDGVVVIPVTAKGKKVSAEGVFEPVSDAHGKEAAAEHAKQQHEAHPKPANAHANHEARPPQPMKHGADHKHDLSAFHLKGTGIVIR